MKVAKHCELCGEYSENAFYRFIGEIEHMILLNSPFISRIDTENNSVILKTGHVMNYLCLTAQDRAVSIVDFIPHIFCSERCEDEFIRKHTIMYRNDLHLKTAVIQYRQSELFSPLSVAIENLEHQSVPCEICNADFPNLSKSFSCFPILDSKTIVGTLVQPPMIDLSRYPLSFNDMNEKHPNGTWYLLSVDFDRLKQAILCSNECAFEYARSKNNVLVFKNNMLSGVLTSISPFTVRINQGLHNKNIYRPQKIQREDAKR